MFCPNCRIGLNTNEKNLRFCMNCKANWDIDEEIIDDYEEDESEFQRCDDCDGHDACADFGCAIKAGIIQSSDW